MEKTEIVMDYEKKYNEALERARKAYNAILPENRGAKKIIEDAFPELRESEDERVMGDLIGGLMWQRDNLNSVGPHDNSLILPGFCLTVGEHLAYLEKQKESLHISETCKENADSFTDACKDVIVAIEKYLDWLTGYPDYAPKGKYSLRDMLYCLSLLEKQKPENVSASTMIPSCWAEEPSLQKEQKPADDKAFEEWIDDWWKHNKVNNPHSYDNGDEIQFDERGFKNFCRGIRNMYQQKPAEWSEEDELNCNRIIRFLEPRKTFFPTKETKEEMQNWLKNRLKSLRPVKQEWSEEDEDFINMLILHFNYLIDKGGDSVETYKSYREKLKSLHPSWKPSEEQMAALERTIRLANFGAEENRRKALESLHDQLEKLT